MLFLCIVLQTFMLVWTTITSNKRVDHTQTIRYGRTLFLKWAEVTFSVKLLRLVCSSCPVNLYSLTPILFCLIARPFLVNELEQQYLLHDRRKVYEVLTLENSFKSSFALSKSQSLFSYQIHASTSYVFLICTLSLCSAVIFVVAWFQVSSLL
jgi:hypothetical protein